MNAVSTASTLKNHGPKQTNAARLFTSVTAVTLSGLLLAACGTSDADDSVSDAPSTVRATETTTATISATTDHEESTTYPTEAPTEPDRTGMLGRASTERKEQAPAGEYDLHVEDVRVGAHHGFDRVVFEFSGDGTPGWFIDYTTQPVQQGSGFPVEYEGSVALEVIIRGIPYPFDLDIPEDEWPTPGLVAEAAGDVTGVSYQSTFEGQSHYVVGLNAETPYSVTLLEEPTRLVIDIERDL